MLQKFVSITCKLQKKEVIVVTLVEAVQIAGVGIALAGLLLEYKKYRSSKPKQKKPPSKPREGN
jgi:hypothetical protein